MNSSYVLALMVAQEKAAKDAGVSAAEFTARCDSAMRRCDAVIARVEAEQRKEAATLRRALAKVARKYGKK